MSKLFVLTPVGTADWPHLITPDYGNEKAGFKDAVGSYKIKLVIPKSAEADKMAAAIEAAANEAHKAAVAAVKEHNAAQKDVKKKKPLPTRAPSPVKDLGDSYLVTAKQKAVISSAKGTFNMKPKVYDAKNKPWDESIQITSGSKIRINVEVSPYDSAIGVSVTLRLKDAQVIELAKRRVEADEASPFGAVEEEEVSPFGAVDTGSDDDTGVNDDFDDI